MRCPTFDGALNHESNSTAVGIVQHLLQDQRVDADNFLDLVKAAKKGLKRVRELLKQDESLYCNRIVLSEIASKSELIEFDYSVADDRRCRFNIRCEVTISGASTKTLLFWLE